MRRALARWAKWSGFPHSLLWCEVVFDRVFFPCGGYPWTRTHRWSPAGGFEVVVPAGFPIDVCIQLVAAAVVVVVVVVVAVVVVVVAVVRVMVLELERQRRA